MSMEELKYLKKIDNIVEYVKDGIKSGRFTVDEVAKFARVHARQETVGKKVATIMKNGLNETNNTVRLDKKTGEPDWIVTNPNGEEYVVSDSTFRKKYELDPEDPSQYKPVGAPVLSLPINEHIEFDAPWGEPMKIEAGGSLILNSPTNIYGIQKEEFESTYASTGKDKVECLKEAISMLGITEEELLEARQESEQKVSSRDSIEDKSVEEDTSEL